jgi:putative FmdB family regulatory protein
LPLYTYACPKCGTETTEFNTVANRAVGPMCCGSVTEKTLSAANLGVVLGGGSFQGYKCPVTDQWVTSRKQRRNIMAEHNLIEAGDSSQKSRERYQRMLDSTNGTGVSD